VEFLPPARSLIRGALLFQLLCAPAGAQPNSNAAAYATSGNTPASLVDGIYIGTTQRISGANTEGCAPDGPISIEVREGRLRLPWRPLQTFDGKIDPRGGFYVTTGNTYAQADKHMMIVPTMQGHVVDGRITGEYGTRWCSYRFEAEKH
jgi:hypothetical protein